MERFLLLPVFLLTFTFLIHTGDSIFYRGSESYMSDVNLERFYLMEENVMSNADVLMRDDYFGPEAEETEEEHRKHALNMTEMESMLARAKTLHTEVGPDLGHFLGHPINVFHLFRRLVDEWRKGLDLLLESSPCKLWKIRTMRRYLTFLRENVPGDEDVRMVVKHLAKLQKIQGTPTREVANGKLGNIQAGEPLSVEEQYQIGTILYEEEDVPAALSWFELVDDWLKSASDLDPEELSFSQTDLLSKMATGYYAVGRLDDAVSLAKRLLDLDKSNRRAQDNLDFFLRKQALQKTDGPPKSQSDKVGLKTRMERICAGKEFKLSRKVCVLEPVYGGSRGWYCHKKEVLRRHPEIAIYHDAISSFAMEQMKEYTHSKLTNKAWISSSAFITPQMGAEIFYQDLPRQKSVRYSAQKLSQAFSQVPVPKKQLLLGWGRMQILNTGRTGIHMKLYEEELQLKPFKHEKGLGAMFAFLTEPKQGGEIVMKNWRLITPAPKGSILVYYSSESRLHSLCPTLGGSQWVAVQPFYERDPRYVHEETTQVVNTKHHRKMWMVGVM